MASRDPNERPIGEVRLHDVRISFPNIFNPKAPKPDKDGKVGEPTYQASFLIPKGPEGDKNRNLIHLAIDEAMEKTFGTDKSKWPKIKPEKSAYRDGDDEDWDGYQDCMYVSARNRNQPKIVDKNPHKALEKKDGRPYGGCFVNPILRFWAQDSRDWGKRLNCSLEAVQFFRDGEAFGAAPVDPSKAFDNFGDDDDDAGFDDQRSRSREPEPERRSRSREPEPETRRSREPEGRSRSREPEPERSRSAGRESRRPAADDYDDAV